MSMRNMEGGEVSASGGGRGMNDAPSTSSCSKLR